MFGFDPVCGNLKADWILSFIGLSRAAVGRSGLADG